LLACESSFGQVDVLTQHNDINRTGWNNNETSLNTSNVGPATFGKLWSRQMDDIILAQPLVATGVTINGSSKNVVIVCTANNSIYAWDADNASVTTPYWQVNFTRKNMRPPLNSDIVGAVDCPTYVDIPGHMGIIGTPVINRATNSMYVVSRSTDGTNFFADLHEINISTGADVISSVNITATVTGTGDGGSTVTFFSHHQNQRPGLLLLNGILWVAFGSQCDLQPYHGWLFGYDATTLQQRFVFCTTPNGQGGGIWASGGGPAADASGNIYLATGNGDGDATLSGPNKGESALKLTPNLANNTIAVSSFFMPFNAATLDAQDLDFGPTESLLIPGSHMVLTGCKDGSLYFMNGDNMGGFNPGGPNLNKQTMSLGQNASLHATLAYYTSGPGNENVYVLAENSALKSFPYIRSTTSFGSPTNSGIVGPVGQSGGFLSVSSNASAAGSAILWVSHAIAPCDANQAPPTALCQGILRALDATDVTKELWNSANNLADTIGLYAKFVCPTVANGKVYMCTFSGKLLVYGLTGADPCAGMQNVALQSVNPAATYSASSSANGTTPAMAFDNNLSTAWNAEGSDGFANIQEITVDLGSIYDLCRVEILWGAVFGSSFQLQASNDNVNYVTLQNISQNTSLDNIFNVLGQTYRYIRMQGVQLSSFGNNQGYIINEMRVFGQPSNGCAPPSVLTSSNITQNTATVSWNAVSNAASYNFQYKTTSATGWTTSNQTGTSVNLTGLACGTDYLYQVQTVCAGGNSTMSPANSFSTSACTVSCTLNTRWTSSDVGAVGIAGSACENDNIPANPAYTVQGSGADIGGTADAFHFAYHTITTDENFIATVETQDATNPSNKAGVMMRETTNADSRFAFVGLTSGNGVVFEYRSTIGGTAVSHFISGITAPSYLRLTKNGSTFTAWTSADGVVWTQVGPTINLGFGMNTNVVGGMAITSHNNAQLSVATIDNVLEQNSPLAIKLSSFTAQNINNQYVALEWTTSMEQNNNYFIVQRSADGVQFADLLNVPGIGNSVLPTNYSARDNAPLQGINYYRLKSVDFDGKYTFSPVLIVRFGSQVAPMLFPNPASTFFTVVAGQEPMKDITIFDMTGKSVRRATVGPGTTVVKFYSGDMTPGVYLVQITTSRQAYVKKLIRQ
jgi:hypothetical protein